MTFTLAPAIAAVGLGAYISADFIRDIYFALKSEHWPTTNGRVIRLDVIQSRSATRSTYESALVGYEYEVRGVRYTSKRIDYAGRGGGWSHWGALQYLRRYHEGESVPVRYDPKEPERAVLETGVTFGNFFRLLFGFAVLGLGLLSLLAS
jgi:hypothetical protein